MSSRSSSGLDTMLVVGGVAVVGYMLYNGFCIAGVGNCDGNDSASFSSPESIGVLGGFGLLALLAFAL
jgi:hypothetical protein